MRGVQIEPQWSGQVIKIDVTSTEIAVSMSLAEFIEALATEAGNPALMFTEQQLRDRLRAAADRVVLGMKQETARVM